VSAPLRCVPLLALSRTHCQFDFVDSPCSQHRDWLHTITSTIVKFTIVILDIDGRAAVVGEEHGQFHEEAGTPSRCIQALQGVYAIANRPFNTHSFHHRSLLRRHKNFPPDYSVGFAHIQAVSERIEKNFTRILDNAQFTRSHRNGRRVSLGTMCADKNQAREVGLDRALFEACNLPAAFEIAQYGLHCLCSRQARHSLGDTHSACWMPTCHSGRASARKILRCCEVPNVVKALMQP
jgi:hypothetical protein